MKKITYCLLLFLLPFRAPGQAGTLDASFGNNGRVTTDFGSGYNTGNAAVLQPDGKIVVAGYTGQGTNVTFANPVIARYNTDGSLDDSFDSDGKVVSTFGNTHDYINAVALQNDGKIVVAGSTTDLSQPTDMAIARYNTDGSLDNTFAGDGVQTVTFSGSSVLSAVAIQADGKVVAGGYSVAGPNTFFTVVRFNSNGSLDNSFDGDGKLTTVITNYYDQVYCIAIQADGKILAGGATHNGSNLVFVVVRYDADGSIDNSFSSDGIQTVDFGGGDGAMAIKIQPDGKILLVGRGTTTMALARLNTDGSLDNSFGGAGKISTGIGTFDIGNAVELQADGKIVIAGESHNGTNTDFSIARYHTNGDLDTSFSSDGKLMTDFTGTPWDRAKAVLIQSDGKIVLAGTAGHDFGLVRYNGVAPSIVDNKGLLEQDFNVYPNPFHDEINVNSKDVAEVVLFDMAGNQLIKKRIKKGETIINTSCLAPGAYTVRYTISDVVQFRNVLKF